ncbi:MAG: alpha/beta fold hydrolase [Verrucomicrobiota bacterium]|nr:alpha/beta fold hydrolase [Verrucomicrobiota bacterium]
MNDYSAHVWTRLTGFFGVLNSLVILPLEPASARPPLPIAMATGSANPVLLIHGIHDSAASMKTLSRWLEQEGREVHTLSLQPNDGTLPLPDLARQIRAFVRETFPAGAKIDLVGFSMGGVVSRYYLQRLGGARRVDRFVSISAPNHGSWLAFLSNKPGCVQMRPRSAFLRDLNAGTAPLARVRLTNLWSPLDLTIVPATSSRMSFGKEVRKWVVAHPLMILYPGSLRAISEALADSQ